MTVSECPGGFTLISCTTTSSGGGGVPAGGTTGQVLAKASNADYDATDFGKK